MSSIVKATLATSLLWVIAMVWNVIHYKWEYLLLTAIVSLSFLIWGYSEHQTDKQTNQ